MNKEKIEHRERLKILEKHIGEYYYTIGNIHLGISDAMKEYNQAKLDQLEKENEELKDKLNVKRQLEKYNRF